MNQEFAEYLKSKNASVYTPNSPGYDFLEDGEYWICFENPNESEDLLIRSSEDAMLLCFDQWSQSFPNDPQGILELIEQMESIMDDRSYIWKAKIGSQNFISLVNDDPGVFYEMARNGFHGQLNGRMFSMLPEAIEQSFVFWDPLMMDPEKTLYLN